VIDSKASLPGPAGGAALALTQVPCGDHVEIEAEFSRWVNAPRIGLALNVDPQQETGYAFLLVAPEVQKAPTGPLTPEIEKKQPAPRRKPVPPRPPRSVSLGTGRQEFGGRLTMQILRNGVRLREQVVPVADGPLVLRAIRKGERLTFLVKDRTTQHALTFEDLFPFSGAQAGVFGVYWPNGAEIELKAWRQALPAAPSPLERGDRLYALKQYDEALSAYRTTASATRDPEVRQEARCKEALCLQALLRPGDAAALFEQVAAEQGPRWPVVAACQLWPERVRQGRFEDADAIFHRLTSHYQPEQVAVLIPDEVRQRIRAAYHEQIRRSTRQDSYYLVRFDPERARNLDRALAVEKFLQGPQDNPQPLNELKVFLIPGYHRTGQLDRAVQMAEELLADPGFTDPWQQLSVVEDYTWLMLERGTPEKALVVVNRFLLDPSGGYRLPYLSLLVTRARVHAARKQWEQAEKDVEELFRQLSAERYILLDAHILRGFLRERRGDQAGALEAWRQGWSKIKGTDAMFSVQGGVLASLANDLTVADAEQLIARAMAKLSAASPIASALKNNLLPGNFLATVLRERFRTKRGLDYARRFALHDLTPLDYHGLAFPLTVAEAFHQGAVTGELTPEQDDLLWKAAYDLYQGFAVTGKFTEAQAFQGILAWMGTSGVLGWSGLARTLDPSSRGPLAYVYGHRFLRLKKPAEAADLFRTAVKDAPPGSPLRRLAEAELERLKPAGKGG
jgi:tetratricopeptide (TPR) repeat protein